MSRKIIIIHHSEIIRKGLSSILRNYFNIEIIQLSEQDEIKTLNDIINTQIILFYGNEDLPINNQLSRLKSNNKINTIGFSNNPEKPGFNFDHFINLDTPPLEIRDIVEECLNSSDNLPNEKEGEELSIREKDVLKLVASGYSNKKIAETLFISIHTVISHRKNITEKTGIKSISGLTVYAILNNIIDTENINPEDLI